MALSPEAEALSVSTPYLVSSVDINSLLLAALGRRLINDRMRTECVNETDAYRKAEKFLEHVQRATNADKRNFHIFLEILKETGQTVIESHLNDKLLLAQQNQPRRQSTIPHEEDDENPDLTSSTQLTDRPLTDIETKKPKHKRCTAVVVIGVLTVIVSLLAAAYQFTPIKITLNTEDTCKMKDFLNKYTDRIKIALSGNKQGFAILVGMTSVTGAVMDTRNMESSFKELDFAVLEELSIEHCKLSALIKAITTYPYTAKAQSCKVIVFYFAGQGNLDSKKKLSIVTGDSLYLDTENVFSPFHPTKAPQLKNIKRLFFFDIYLQPELGQKNQPKPNTVPLLEYTVPMQGKTLVAFSASYGDDHRGDVFKGGHWTRFLCKNLLKDQDISLVLADTWNETVSFVSGNTKLPRRNWYHGPSWTSCMERLNLKRLDTNHTK